MSINITFLVVCHFVARIVDWIIQSEWQALNKSKFGEDDDVQQSWLALVSHSFIYASITVAVLALMGILSGPSIDIVWLVLLFSHIVIDTRIMVKRIATWKGIKHIGKNSELTLDSISYPSLIIGIDQRLHELVILVLAFFI